MLAWSYEPLSLGRQRLFKCRCSYAYHAVTSVPCQSFAELDWNPSLVLRVPSVVSNSNKMTHQLRCKDRSWQKKVKSIFQLRSASQYTPPWEFPTLIVPLPPWHEIYYQEHHQGGSANDRSRAQYISVWPGKRFHDFWQLAGENTRGIESIVEEGDGDNGQEIWLIEEPRSLQVMDEIRTSCRKRPRQGYVFLICKVRRRLSSTTLEILVIGSFQVLRSRKPHKKPINNSQPNRLPDVATFISHFQFQNLK